MMLHVLNSAPAAHGWANIEAMKPFYHEAGHAVVATLTGFEVAWVSTDAAFIRSNELAIENNCASGDPVCMTLSSKLINPILNRRSVLNKHDREIVIGYCMHVLAGPEVERRCDPDGFFPEHSRNDYGQVMGLAGFLEKRKPFRKKILNDAERRLGKMLDACWHEVCEVARALHARKTLTGNEVSEIIQLGEAKKAA